MTLELNDDDLRPEFKDLSASQIKYKHFSDKVQKAIDAVGKAMYFGWARQTHQAIYPPKNN